MKRLPARSVAISDASAMSAIDNDIATPSDRGPAIENSAAKWRGGLGQPA
ncbi:hypothetical protein ABOK31_25680 [Rhizobium sp. ZPR4]|uniref:Uncharacterized protein n=1 Tax=Rhizobium sp. ZPR4 TaxID=3158966 RepID=A0AAU7SIW4_9HYPH